MANKTRSEPFDLFYEHNYYGLNDKSNRLWPNEYTDYRFVFRGKTFIYDMEYPKPDSITISGISYTNVRYIGTMGRWGPDSTSYIAYKYGIGLLRVQLDYETWDLLP